MSTSRLFIDAADIRQAYNAGFEVWVGGEEEQASVVGLRYRLEEHIRLLLPEVEDVTARMRGEWRRLGIHVLIRAYHVMKDSGGTSPQAHALYVQDLAELSRSLLALYEHPVPLGAAGCRGRRGGDCGGGPSACLRSVLSGDP
ncbi:DUF6415 family natural product biosynthesis protein [Streptomyces sp. NPDC001635]